MLAEVTVFGMVIFGLVIIGGFGIGALHYGKNRKWQQHAGSFTLGASVGGFIALFLWNAYGNEYLDLYVNFLTAIGLFPIIQALFPYNSRDFLDLCIVIGGMAIGGLSMWFFFICRRPKDDETA